MKYKLFFSLFILFCFPIFNSKIFSQEVNKPFLQKIKLSGILAFDENDILKNEIIFNKASVSIKNPAKKSELLAGILSAVLPGAGEIYSGSYLKGAIFITVEAAAITTALIYNHKGNTQTIFFQNYADAHWSASRYAYWTAQNLKTLAPDMPDADVKKYQAAFQSINGPVNWALMNQMEAEIGSDPNADGYTHQVPPTGQDHYELIGKYDQYSKGWDQSNLNTFYTDLPSQFLWYAHQRGLANEYYWTGSTAVVFIYLNHILSTLDAVWVSHKYNDALSLKLSLQNSNVMGLIEPTPTFNFSFRF